MVADRLLVELGADRQVSVGAWLDGELVFGSEPFMLAWLPGDGELEDLRWYLEDYLRAPFGVYGDRGSALEARLADWGAAAFDAVFGSGLAREAYVQIRARQQLAEIVFRSASPELLRLPWELMRDPCRPMPLALDLGGISRSLPVSEAAWPVPTPGGRLRVLMVISRPGGVGDVGYRMIARPLLERLEAVRGQIDLVVLRPPTFDALRETLAAAEPFQMVHFDGHGVAGGHRAAGSGEQETRQEAALVFEKPGGGAEAVPASRLAQVLKEAMVPVVVLNACQSGAIGKNLEAAVATRLLQEGTAAVVAMAYTVYAVAAAEFMAAFYERLFAGDPVSAAVTAGRQRLFQRPMRPSPKGDMALADWLVPVHYLRRDVSFPQASIGRSAALPLPIQLDQLRDPDMAAGHGDTGELAPENSFVGRDDLFLQLEAASRLQKVVVLHGPGGTGKTELAKAFGRWWRDTDGVENPDWVLWYSFEPGVASFGLDGVITQIGLRVLGSQFAGLDMEKRRAEVQKMLQARRMLLVWDNFETVRSMPDPAATTEPLDNAACDELREFLETLARSGRSAVVITSRTREDWLGDVYRIPVGALASHEAAEYAGNLLAPYPGAGPRRAKRAFGELMEWLDGHPLSMRLILPRLETTEPDTLLEDLHGATPLPGGTGEGRTTSLSASVSYSFAHLAEGTRRLLPVVCLLQGAADGFVLAAFSETDEVPERFRGATAHDWRNALDDAARVGLLTWVERATYQIHPALPSYLAAQWRSEESEDHDALRDASTRALVTACRTYGGYLYSEVESGDAELAFAIIGWQRRTFCNLLGYALDHGLWDRAEMIALALNQFWKARGLDEEARAWAARARLAIEDADGNPPQGDSPSWGLWIFFATSEINRQLGSRLRLHDVELTCQQILAMVQTQPVSPDQQRQLALTYHQLGWAAYAQGKWEMAGDWHRKSLAIREQLDDQPGIASTYHELGMLAEKLGQMEESEDWCRKSLAISKALGNQRDMAISYHQLGWLARLLGRLDEAGDCYRKSLAINEVLANQRGMAADYKALGAIARDRGRLDDAEKWCLKSLIILEEIGDQSELADTYHMLGFIAWSGERLDDAEDWYHKSLAIRKESEGEWVAMTYQMLGAVAEVRGRLDDAEDLYRKSLAIREGLDSKPALAWSYGQLGGLAARRGQSQQALDWMIKSVTQFDEFPHPATQPAPVMLAMLAFHLGVSVLEQGWQDATGSPLPAAVLDYVRSQGPSAQAILRRGR